MLEGWTKSKKKVREAHNTLPDNPIFYRYLARLTPEAVVVHSEGKIVYINPTAVKLIGAKSAHELVGQSVMQFIHPESLPLIQDRIKRMLSKKRVAPFAEEKFINLTGKVVVAETKAVPFTFQGKDAILAILHDITQKKKYEDVLKKNEERFRTLIQESADAIQLLDATGKILYTSDSIKRVLGYSPKEIQGKNGVLFLHPEDWPKFMKIFGELVAHPGSQATLQYRVKHKNGSWQWIEATGVNHLQNPVIGAIVGNFRNITQRKKTEEREKFLEKISTILGSSIDYKVTLQNISKLLVPFFADYIRIALIDENNTLEEVGVYHEEHKKRDLVKKLYETYKGTKSTYGVENILATGKAEIMEDVAKQSQTFLQQDPKLAKLVRQLSLTSYMGVPLQVGEQLIGVITFSSVKKERMYTQEDLQFAQEMGRRIAYAVEHAQLYERAKQAIILRDDFMSLASHELKTPLASLKMYTQSLDTLFKQKNDASLAPYFTRINQQVDKLSLLVNDLLNVAKIRHGELAFHMGKMDVATLVEETVQDVQAITRKHKMSIKGKIKKLVVADRYRIYQVLTNLLTNAIKYSPTAKKVVVTLSDEKKNARVSVTDFGIGIDKNEQEKIFEQFYRVNNSEEKTFPGLGMGLFISQEIIKRHNGILSVMSKKGKGSTFSFTLPYASPKI